MVGRETTDVGDDAFGGGDVAVAGEPAGGLGAEEHAEEKEYPGDELDGEGDDPLGLGGDGDGTVCGVVDPVRGESVRASREKRRGRLTRSLTFHHLEKRSRIYQ